MKKYTKLTSLFVCVMMLCVMLAPMSVAAEQTGSEREHYIEIEIPVREVESVRPEVSRLRASNPLVGTVGTLNAFFNPGQTQAASYVHQFDFCDDTIPGTARITNVTVTSTRTAVSGVTYYVGIGRGTANGDDWAPDLLWNSTVNTSWFNGEDPWGMWGIDLYATRVITNPSTDIGSAATLKTITLRIYYTV